MFRVILSLRSLALALVVSGLTAGCVSPHAWQTPREMSAVLTDAKQWPELRTNLYARVEQNHMPEAVSMLQESAWRKLESDQVAVFTPALSQPADDKLRPYLVRGITYSSRPAWTGLRFDASTGRLLVRQASWNGEIFLPYRRSEPNALVVFLPTAPTAVYPDAWLGGDGIESLGTDHR